jgi:hypothetical protein
LTHLLSLPQPGFFIAVQAILRGEKCQKMAQAFMIAPYYLMHNQLTYEGLQQKPSYSLHKGWYFDKYYLIYTSFKY